MKLTMSNDDGYDIPEAWCQALNDADQELDRVKGWQEFKSHWKEMTGGMNMKPLSENESMVMILSSLNEDNIWSTDDVREDPTEEEEKEDLENFKQYLKRLISNAPAMLEDYIDGNGGLVIEVGGHKVTSQSVFNSAKEEEKAVTPQGIKQEQRMVMGYKMPTGKVEGRDAGHAVLGGWMTQDAWDKVKFGRKEELTEDELKSFNEWRENHQVGEAGRKKVKADEEELREWVEKKLADDLNTVRPGPTQTVYARTDFGIQCFLLNMLPRLSRKPSWMGQKDWVEDELGLESIDHLYPVVTSEGRLFQLSDLIFNFGYGPNYFDWTVHKPYRLKGTPTTLYLVSMDVGKIAGIGSASVWKIGITKNDVVGSSPKQSRFSGKVGEHVRVIREKLYQDGRDAFMIEQTIIKMSDQESFYDREQLGPSFESDKAFKALKSLDHKIVNNLGYSEWIFPHKSEEEVVSIYERMTAYGEFHGDGNVSYSTFKRDFDKA